MRKSETSCPACSGSGIVGTVPVFVQIESTPAGLFALAEDGTVWVYVRNPRDGWKPISMSALNG